MKKFVSVCLVFVMLSMTFVSASASRMPICSIGMSRAVPVGRSVYGACVISSDNGFRSDLRLSADYFEISGTGKVELSDFFTTITDNTVHVRFKVTGTYPGEAKITIKPFTVYDKEGYCNSSGTVPARIDVKIFNTEGDAAYEKMSDIEFFFTVIIAPVWSLLHKIGLV